MTIATILLLALTFVLLFYILFFRQNFPQVKLKSLYLESYRQKLAKLEKAVENGQLSEEVFEQKKVILSRELLAVAKEERTFSKGTLFLFMLIGIFLMGGITHFFWQNNYTVEEKQFDKDRLDYLPLVEGWLKEVELGALREGASYQDLEAPSLLFSTEEGYRATFRALNYLSTKSEHTDLKTLYVLAGMYLENANQDGRYVDTLYNIYLDLYEVEKTPSFFLQSSIAFLQYLRNDETLTPQMERFFDGIATQFPDEEGFVLGYSDILTKAGKEQKAQAYLQHFYRRAALPSFETIGLTQEENNVLGELKLWVAGYSLDKLRNRSVRSSIAYPESFLLWVEESPEKAQRVLQGLYQTLNQEENDEATTKSLYLLTDFYLKQASFFLVPPILALLEEREAPNYIIDRTYLNLEFSLAYYLGEQAKGRLTDALKNRFDRLVEANPEEVNASFEYGFLLGNNEFYEEAIPQLRYFSYYVDEPTIKATTEKIIADFEAKAQQSKQTHPSSKEEEEKIYQLLISLGEGVEMEDFSTQGVLFISLRDGKQQGGPPIAAKRIPLEDIDRWPLLVTLSKQDLLLPTEVSLNHRDSLQFLALFSQQGEATYREGDYQSQAISIEVKEEPQEKKSTPIELTLMR